MHFAIAMSDVGAFVKKLESMNMTYSDWPGNPGKVTTRADGIIQIYFQDPDGHWIEVNSASGGQSNTSMVSDKSVESQIIAIEKSGWEAWKNKDVEWFQDNLTEEAVLINTGGMSNKAGVVKSTATDCEVKSYSLDNFKVVMLSKDTVLMTYTAMQDAVCGGKKIPAKVRTAVNYVKRNGKWLEALYMETPLEN